MIEWTERMGFSTVAALLVVLQLVSVYFLWALNPASQAHETHLALFLSVNLVSFSMVSYVYRTGNKDNGTNGPLLVVGCLIALLFMLAGAAV